MTRAAQAWPGLERFRPAAVWTIAFLAVAASLTGITNGFALDDVHIIVENERVHSLARVFRVFAETYWPPEEGSSLYRPFTSVAFVLQWALGGGSPLPFHITSIVLYAMVSVAVFRFASALVEWPVAWLAAALFAVHPLHVEVVANVVGQAELWAALFAIPAATRFIRARDAGALTRRDVLVIPALFGAALMFKEHVIVLPAILIVAELIRGKGSVAARARAIAPLIGAMALVAVGFVALRTSVIGSLEGAGVSPIFIDQTFTTRFFTMLRVIMEWIRLFFWPAQLAADYSPPRIQIATSFEADMLPGLVVLPALGLIAFHLRRTMPAVTLSLAWAGILLLIPSNLIVVTGFVLAERALFLPSVGVMIATAATLDAIARLAAEEKPSSPRLIAGVAATFLVLGILKSSARNIVWRDNAALIVQTVEDSPTSARAHMMMAQLHSDRGQMREALEEAMLAVQLGPKNDRQLLAFSADMFQMGGKCHIANDLYARSLALEADQPQVRLNAAICLAQTGQFEKARVTARGGDSSKPANPELLRIAQLSDSVLAGGGRVAFFEGDSSSGRSSRKQPSQEQEKWQGTRRDSR